MDSSTPPFYKSSMKRIIVLFCILGSLLHANAQKEPVYLFEDFEEGVVYLKNHQKSHAKINYDTSNLKMAFINEGSVLQIDDNSLIDSVVVGKQVFIPYSTHFVERVKLVRGVLLVDWKLVDKYTGKKVGAMGIGNGGSIEKINTGLLYARAITDDKSQEIHKLVNDNTYYLNFNGNSLKFKNEKQLLKGIPSYKDKVKIFIKKNKTDFSSCEDVIVLSEYVVTLDQK